MDKYIKSKEACRVVVTSGWEVYGNYKDILNAGLIAVFTSEKRADEYIAFLNPKPVEPEWPKEGERYVWKMSEPDYAEGLTITQVVYRGKLWAVELKFDHSGFRCYSLEGFQQACQEYRDYIANKKLS